MISFTFTNSREILLVKLKHRFINEKADWKGLRNWFIMRAIKSNNFLVNWNKQLKRYRLHQFKNKSKVFGN